ncbi:OFA family MFS transporter [Anaerotalea alkaliphila]|uniref:OFA family MFS transporter n=1 Tax=Anaerotalea alkaliphila TaxID=2662126 RepID=A0A7X5HV03_9FIRM|nr:OFA family MFS transporter [Anaerotalea alkaliphila]NDL67130.1 OFA family MFS transporter [Anaerotalea alkaliphila]
MGIEVEKIGYGFRWRFVLLGGLVMICLGTVYSWSVFRLHVERGFGVGATLSGLPYMTSLAFYAVMMLLSGRVLDRHSPRRLMVAGTVLVALGWLLSAYATGIWTLTLAYGVVIGTGVGITYGVPMVVVSRWFPEKKGLAIGLVLGGFGLSPVVTAPLASALIMEFGLARTFGILGVAYGILLPVLSLFFRHPTQEEVLGLPLPKASAGEVGEVEVADIVKTRQFRVLYWNFLTGAMIGLTFIGMTGHVGMDAMGLSSRQVDGLIPLFALSNGAGRPLFGWLADRYKARRVMRLSFALMALGSVLMLVAEPGRILLFALAFSLFWMNLGGWLAIAPSVTGRMFGARNYSRNYGIVFTAYGIGAILGVLASGMLVDLLHDLRPLFLLVLLLCASGIYRTRKHGRAKVLT